SLAPAAWRLRAPASGAPRGQRGRSSSLALLKFPLQGRERHQDAPANFDGGDLAAPRGLVCLIPTDAENLGGLGDGEGFAFVFHSSFFDPLQKLPLPRHD